MRVTILTASLMLTCATVMLALPAPSYAAGQCKTTCTCDCPAPTRAPVKAPFKVQPMRHAAHRIIRRIVRHEGYYDYAMAAPVRMGAWHGAWHVAAPGYVPMPGPVYYAPRPAYYGPPPVAYGPPPGYYDSQMQIDDRGFGGGVGYAEGGGGGGGGSGFADGFGQVHFANGGNSENGPTYNSYNQSFQSNPSMGVAGPFQSRSMGGFAPSK